MKKHLTEIKWQFIVFGTYAALALVQAYSEHPSEGIYSKEIFGIIGVVLSECVLVNLLGNWLMVRFPFSKKPLPYMTFLGVLLLSFLIFRYFSAYPEHVDVLKSYNGNQDENSIVFFTFISTINFVISFLVALGVFSIKKSLRMEQKALLLEKEVNMAKLSMLKHQVNPHFLYNTLSYIYSQARPVSETLSKSILILSEMMRYSLSKTNEDGLTPLEKEIQYIENFIEIHRLRFDSDFCLEFEVEGVIGNKKIVPLILITFVENALKHGILNNPKDPIVVKILVQKNLLELFVRNLKQGGTKDETSGIGLINTQKRLEMAYPNRHTLEIIDKPDYFAVTLKIDLNGD